MRSAIVVLAWNCWDETEACLLALADSIGPDDRVVVVDNGSVDATPAGLRRFPWVHVITNSENRGFAAGSNQGARWALDQSDRPEFVVFLNNDTVPVCHWLDELLAAFENPEIGAAGPRSNRVSGPQFVDDAVYGPPGGDSHRAFVAAWEDRHRGQTREIHRLVGFALAVRATALDRIGLFAEEYGTGGFEDDDLCLRLLDDGWMVVIADGSFVHHTAHATFEGNGVDWSVVETENSRIFLRRRAEIMARRPLLSACLIVKDEEESLARCLGSLHQVVDEVIVYDTGSTDGTVALARRGGAVVVEGYWDDDFARARNAALRHCRGRWILHIDADEMLEADARELRGMLESQPPVDVFTVDIFNLIGDGENGAGYNHRAMRLFRNERCHWEGRLHEQVVHRLGITGPLTGGDASGIRIVHYGYLDAALVDRDKLTRNLRVAEAADHDDDRGSPGLADLNLGRSLAALGRFDDAVERFTRADAVLGADGAHRMARLHAAECLIALGRTAEALDWVDRLRAVSSRHEIPDLLEAQARILLGETARAVELTAGVDEAVNEDGFRMPAGTVETIRATALLADGEVTEAADLLLGLIERSADVRTVATATDALTKAGRSLKELAAVIPESALLRAAAALTLIDADQADAAGEELFDRFGARPAILAAAVRFAHRLTLDRALVWSARMRAAGVTDTCPVRTQANGHPSMRRRALAAATLTAAFGDPAGSLLLHRCMAETPDEEIVDVVAAVAAVGALDLSVLASATATPQRCGLVAGLLRSAGVTDAADALDARAVALGSADTGAPAPGPGDKREIPPAAPQVPARPTR